MQKGLVLFKPFDFGIMVPVLGAIIASFLVIYSGSGAPAMVKLQGAGGEWVFPLDASEFIHIPGPLGDSLVEIKGGGARIIASPCLNQICVAAGTVRFAGQWTACLPNRVLLYLGEAEGGNVDATSW